MSASGILRPYVPRYMTHAWADNLGRTNQQFSFDGLQIGLYSGWQYVHGTHHVLGELVLSGDLVRYCVNLLLYGTGCASCLQFRDLRLGHVIKESVDHELSLV